jgi:hypothetical protein
VINSCGTFYGEVSVWETRKWRITGQKIGLRSFGVWRHLVWEVYISVSEQSDTSIFMVKGICLLGCEEVWFGREIRTF